MDRVIEVSLEALALAPRRSVTAEVVRVGGREAVRVAHVAGLPVSQMIDKPTFVIAPVEMRDGVIEVDVLSRLLPDAPALSRAFAGLAYRIGGEGFEAVYLRPLNGRPVDPPPRDRRAVQYFAYPDWDFERLRAEHPDGSYEAGADIRPDTWMALRLEIVGRRVVAFVDGVRVLEVEGKVAPVSGAVGLWMDIGTEAFFSGLRVSMAES